MRDTNGKKLYPLGDRLNSKELAKLGLNFTLASYTSKTGERLSVYGVQHALVYACPKKGQWYLSGTIPEAYRAPNDLTQKFYLADLVVFRKVEYYEAVKLIGGTHVRKGFPNGRGH